MSFPDLVLIITVVTYWGFTFVPIKIALAEVPPLALAMLRFLFAAVPAMFFVKRPTMPWRDIIAYGIAIGGFQFALLFLGIHMGMPVGLSALVLQTQVFFTIGLAVLLSGDRLTRANLAGGAIAVLGIVELAVYKLASGMTASLFGFLLVVAAGFAWAVGNIIGKKAGTRYRADMFSLVVWSSIMPTLPLALASYAFEGGPAVVTSVLHASWTTWGCVLLLSWGATLFGYGSWAILLHRYTIGAVSPFALLVPVSGMLFGVLLLGETLAPMQTVGASLVFAGLVINVYGSRWLPMLRAR